MIKNKTGKYILMSAALSAVAFFSISCNKDKTEETYMTGILSTDIPSYILAGQTYTFTAQGITDPTDGITYKWTTANWEQDSVIGKTITVNAPTTIGDYTVQVTARREGYVSSTISKLTTVLNYEEGGSFEGITKGDFSMTDPRDGKQYNYSTIGQLDWFTQNLNWAAAGKGHLYLEADAISLAFGRLYTWEDATGGISASGVGGGVQGVCPPGWKIPTNEDWEDLAKSLNNGVAVPFDNYWTGLGSKVTPHAFMNSLSIWKYSPNHEQLNAFKWCALPGGNAQKDFSRYRYLREYGFWWSSTQADASNAYYRYIYFDNADFPYNYTSKDGFGASVRCVRLSQ